MEGQDPDYENNNIDEENASWVDESEVSENEIDSENEIPDWYDDEEEETKPNLTFREVSSLQRTCLGCISKHFDRFNCAYSTSSDDNLRRQLLFLQRKFSRYFLLEKSVDGYLDQSYLNFLINEHLKELYVDVITRCNWKDVLKRIAEVGHSFQKVSFCGFTPDSDEDGLKFVNDIICHMDNVESLDLSSFCNDQILKSIVSSCPKLEELDISKSEVTSKGLKSLCPELDGLVEPKLSKLRVLRMEKVPIEDTKCVENSIKYLLKNIPSLEVLDHTELPSVLCSLSVEKHENKLVSSINTFNISHLDLSSMRFCVSDTLKDIVKVCPHLKVLTLLLQVEYQLDHLDEFKELEELYLDNASLYHFDVNPLLKTIGKGLKILSLTTLSVSIPVLIQCCPKLETLTVVHAIYQSVADNTSKLNKLNELCFGSLKYNDSVSCNAVIQLVNASPNLEKISVKYCDLSEPDDFRTMFSQCYESSMLKHVILHGCDVDETILESILLTCSSLQTLTIEGCSGVDYFIIFRLQNMAQSIRNGIKVIYKDEPSDFSNSDNYDDFFNEYDNTDDDSYDHSDSDDSFDPFNLNFFSDDEY